MKETGFNSLLGEPKDALSFLSQVSSDASQRLSYRVFAESQNIPIKEIPVGGESGLENILSFLPLAKEGFTLNLKSNDVEYGQIRDLLDLTTPISLNELLSGLNIRIKAKVITKDSSLPLFRHTLSTLALLSRSQKVDSSVIKDGVFGVSYWPQLDTEHIWTLLDEIEQTTRKMLLEKDLVINKESAMRATHFFIVGGYLARNFK